MIPIAIFLMAGFLAKQISDSFLDKNLAKKLVKKEKYISPSNKSIFSSLLVGMMMIASGIFWLWINIDSFKQIGAYEISAFFMALGVICILYQFIRFKSLAK